MKSIQILKLTIFCLIFSQIANGQNAGSWSGNFESNVNLFLKDSLIGPFNVPQYDNQFVGGEAWLNLNYSKDDLSVGIRFDMYNNSNLRNPNDSYTDEGIGRWFVQKRINNLDLEVGYIYDQIGSGIIYRAYEQRPLFIDNALVGASAKYNISEDWFVKGFAGRQKNAFDIYGGTIKGFNTEHFFIFGETLPLTLAPGFGFVNRTMSDESMDEVVNAVKNYIGDDRFLPVYNAYLTTFYNTLRYGSLTWYAEAAFKSKDMFFNPRALREQLVGNETDGKFEFKKGKVLYSSVSVAVGNLGVTLEGKRTENFNFRVDPNLNLIRGLVNYIPPMNRQNTYRLTSRYSPATQDISEQAFQVDVQYKFNKNISALVNFSDIKDLDGNQLYSEIYSTVQYKKAGKYQLLGGLQLQEYNQEVYESKPETKGNNVKTVTPFMEFLYKFSRKNSLRTEFQYMDTDQDFGSWFYALAEYSIAPHLLFEASAMYNTDPKKELSNGVKEKILYPTLGVIYNSGPNRYSLRYVKQVEGIVCSGGICRLEPAFNGIRFNMSSNF
jgi:hypothetical protein